MKYLNLNGDWHVCRAQASTSIPARVPGCVHLDLLRAGQIADPFYRDNEASLLWIGETDWTYERDFDVPLELLERAQVLLRCFGLDTLATITLNGVTLGSTDNMYRTWLFDVKPHLKAGGNNISIRFDAPMQYVKKRDAERALPSWAGNDRINSGSWIRKEPCNFGWDWGPKVVTSGIWRDIELIGFDARLTDVAIQQQHQPGGAVALQISTKAVNFTAEAPTVRVQVALAGNTVASVEQPLTDNRADFTVTIDQPELWWINGMGPQPLYDVRWELVGADGHILDETTRRIGLRTLTLERNKDDWGESFYFAINGVPFFAKGANWIPADTFAPRLTHADYERLLQDTVAANMNMLRVWGGGIYEDDYFYELCDQYGIALWHDFMFACGTYPAFDADYMANVRAEAEDNVRRLRHHPSIALWCGNNELEQGLVGDSWTERTMSWEDYGKLFDDLLPSVVQELDPTRPYWPSSPHTPVGPRTDWMSAESGDSHLWGVWHGRQPFEWYRECQHRFVSEFGFQSFPELATVNAFTEPEDHNLTSYVMEYHQRSGIGNSVIIHYLLDWFRLPTTFESSLWLTQILQAMAMKYAVEHWRRNMPRTMGAIYWQLNDCWPAPSWASIDSLGRWKALHYLAKRFYAPVLISGLEDMQAGTVEIHLTSDLAEPRAGVVRWQLTTTDGESVDSGSFAATAAPYQSVNVQTLDLSAQLQRLGKRNALVYVAFESDGQVISDNLVLFVRPKHLALKNPEIQANVRQTAPQQYEVELSAAHPALWVWLSTADGEAKFSDNFVNLMPGETKVISVTTTRDLTPEKLRKYLVVQSLWNTYQ